MAEVPYVYPDYGLAIADANRHIRADPDSRVGRMAKALLAHHLELQERPTIPIREYLDGVYEKMKVLK